MSILAPRNSFRPMTAEWAYEAWDLSEKSHWTFQEVSMQEDCSDWSNKLSVEEKNFLTNIFRFFTQADIDVAGGYVDHYLPYFKNPEVRMMLLSFAAREATHIAAYSHLIETLGMPESTYNEFLQYKEMVAKHEYLLSFKKHTKRDILKSMAVFSGFTEGLQLFSSFVMLLNFVRQGKMKGMGQIISWSVADETVHFESMIKLFKVFVKENIELWDDELKGEIYTIAEKMVELEDAFIDLSFKSGGIHGLTSDEMKRYIRYIADRRLISMGMKGIFKVKKNPLPWVAELLNAPTHTNFFEQRSTDYVKNSLTGDWKDVWA
jgi:ribonucleoside-diphosphate reductase beta chain